MAVTLNAKGTSVPYFKIGRKGTTIFQGTTDPNPTYTVSQGDIWIDTSANEIKIRTASNTWISSAGGSVSALSDLSDIDLSTPATDGQILVWDNANSVFVPADEYGDTDVKTLLSSLDSSIIPSADVTYDLGSPTNQWKDIYVGPGSIYMSGTKIIEEDSVSGNLKFSAASNQSVHILSHGTGDTVLETSNGLDIIAHNSANIDLQVSTGQITFTGDVLANNDLTVTGNLTINGTTTTVNTATLNVSDNIIVLNNDETGTPSQDAGIEVERGTSTNVALAWNETTDRWTFTNDGSTYYNLAVNSDDITEGSTNLWYTDQRVSDYLTSNPQPGNTYGTQIVWDLANPSTSIILDAGDGTANATYYGDVIDGSNNVILDISGASFYGTTNGNHNGDVNDATGGRLVLDVDNGQGTAVLYGDVSGTNITTSNIEVSNYIKGYNSLIAPGAGTTVNYVVTVAAKTAAHGYNGTGSSQGYVFNGLESPFLTLTPGRTYRFIQEEATNSGHPIGFYYDAAKTTAYTDNVTTAGTPGQAGAYTEITVTDSTPTVLHYQCTAHGYMGNAVQTNARNLTGFTTEDLSEGSTNLYYTDSRVDTRLTLNSIGALSDVDVTTTTPTNGDALMWDGSNFVPTAASASTSTTADDIHTHGDTNYYSKEYVLFGTTTDATETEIFIGGVNNTRIPVGLNTTMFYDIKFVARRTDATGEGAGVQIKGAIDNFGNAVVDIGDLYEIIVATDNATISVDATADNTNNALKVTVTGELSKNFRWTAFVKTVEVSQ